MYEVEKHEKYLKSLQLNVPQKFWEVYILSLKKIFFVLLACTLYCILFIIECEKIVADFICILVADTLFNER